jgi:trehalose utilization protein
MMKTKTRRGFLESTTIAATGAAIFPFHTVGPEQDSVQSRDIKVMVWDERQPAQKQAYPNFLGHEIADHLAKQAGISVCSVGLDDPEQGLSGPMLDDSQVLIWWGHVRNREVAPKVGQSIAERIKKGRLSLIALHSAHWSTPFVEAMNERTRIDMSKTNLAAGAGRVNVREIPPSERYTVPRADSRITPYVSWRKYPEGATQAELHMPYCCFPAYRGDGKPSEVRLLRTDHPILKGIPREFSLPQTEMYDEPFHVPEPDDVILEERWAAGEWFRSGMIWKLGQGRIFYFRPGHEIFPIYKQPIPLKILSNAVRWLGSAVG